MKSLRNIINMLKGKGKPLGTISHRKDGDYKKVGNNDWKFIGKGKKKAKPKRKPKELTYEQVNNALRKDSEFKEVKKKYEAAILRAIQNMYKTSPEKVVITLNDRTPSVYWDGHYKNGHVIESPSYFRGKERHFRTLKKLSWALDEAHKECRKNIVKKLMWSE